MVAQSKAGRFISGSFWAGAKRRSLGWLLIVAPIFLLVTTARSWGAKNTEVPVIKGEAGPCTADFTVTDSSSKPLYDVNIHLTIRYGFMDKRKSDLEVGTNGDGKARFEGLPSKVKRPLEFNVRYAGLPTKSLMHDPAINCQASFTVALGSQ